VRGIAAEDYLVLRRWMDVTRDLSQANNRNINMLSSRHMLRHDIAAEISRVSDFRSLPAIEPHFTSIDLQLTSIFTHTHTHLISRLEHVRVFCGGRRRRGCDKENVEARQTNNGYLTGHANNAGERPRPIQQVAKSTCTSTPIVSSSFLISIHETSHLFTFLVNTINIYTNITNTFASCRACPVRPWDSDEARIPL
jgi:hypothetical protein